MTVLFADLVGFTTLAEDRDPEAVRELLSRYFDTATEVIRVHGGTVEKFIGDAVMAVWGTPIAHEDDAERAVRAGLELVDAVAALHDGLQARAGVLTGDAAVTLGATNQGMVAGDLVNTAARLQGVAEAGTVLAGEATKRATESAIVFEPLGEHSLKGKTSPVPAWRAVRVVANRGGQGRTDGLEPPFVGRDEELRQLKEILHGIGRELRPRLVSITGPGGIGKSRLVWELEKYIDGVSEDIWWHRGRSPSYGEGITFWALGEMVRRRAGLTEDADEATTRAAIAATLARHVADATEHERIGTALLSLLGVTEAPPGGRDALFPAWRTFFESIATGGTTVLVFEDLQWADSGTLDFIEHLLDWSRGLPIMVVTLARPELFDRRPDWGQGRRQLTALALEPLPESAMHELLDGLVPGLPADALAAIVGRAEGVPLYAVEMVRGLLADGLIERRGDAYAPVGDLAELRVPESLRSLIASRLDALDPADRALVQDASVLGQVFSAESLAAVQGAEPERVAEQLRGLVRREILDLERDPKSPERGQYKFVQALIREVAYGTLARRDRRARHLAVARHYEAAGDEELAGALANHYLSAHGASDEGPEADAIAAQARLALTGAADRAAALGSHQQAVAYLEQALAITVDTHDRAVLLDRAARSSSIAATTDSERYATDAIAAYRELGDLRATLEATTRLGRILLDASEVDRAAKVLEDAAREADELGELAVVAEIQANLARAMMRLGRPEDGVAAADRALSIAEVHDLEAVVAEALGNKAACYSQLGRRREARALHTAAVAIAVTLPDRSFELRARNNLASAVGDEDPARSTQMFVESARVAQDIGDRGVYAWQIANAAVGALIEGHDWDHYYGILRELYPETTLPSERARLLTFIIMFESRRGGGAESMAELEALVDDDAGHEVRWMLHMARVHMSYARRDPATAVREARRALDIPTQAPDLTVAHMLRGGVRAGDAEVVREAADRFDSIPLAGPAAVPRQLFVRGARAVLDGRATEAVADFRAAVELGRSLGELVEAADLAIDALAMAPEEPELRDLAESFRPLLEELQAAPALADLDAFLAAGAPAHSPVVASAAAGVAPQRD